MPTPREIGDHIEIQQVLARYLRSMDERDYGLLDRVFTPDAQLRFQALQGADLRYPEMLPRWRDFNAHFRFLQHVSSQILIDVGADTARAHSNLRAVHVQETHEGELNTWVIYGVYRDRLVRRDAGWRIAERVFEGRHTEGRLIPFDRVRRFSGAAGS